MSPQTALGQPYDLAYVPYGSDLIRANLMMTYTASDARAQLYRLIDQTAESHGPAFITGPRHNTVLVSEEDWEAIQETLHLLSIPGIRESMQPPSDQLDTDLDW